MSINEKIDIAVDGIGTKAGEFDISTAGETLILDYVKSNASELGISAYYVWNEKMIKRVKELYYDQEYIDLFKVYTINSSSIFISFTKSLYSI